MLIPQRYGDILCMYPEARYSPIGTTAILPDSLGKLVKQQGVPVVVLLHHGNYLHTPFWNYRKPRKVPLYSTMTQVLSAGVAVLMEDFFYRAEQGHIGGKFPFAETAQPLHNKGPAVVSINGCDKLVEITAGIPVFRREGDNDGDDRR